MVESAEPYREFIREMTLRIERAMREIGRESREERRVVLAEIRDFRDEYRAEMKVLHAEMHDAREESRAQRHALLAMIDRLQGNGPEPPT